MEYAFDAAGRQTASIQFRRHDELRRTTTTYGGSADGYRVTVTPPVGAPATATIENAKKQLVEQRTYRSNSPSGSYDALSYTYTPTGELAAVSDPAGNTWSWEHDLQGRRIKSSDPDSGTTQITYDAAGQVTSTKDARGEVLTYKFDSLGRQTERRDGSSGTLLASWTYDTVEDGLGLPATATRYANGDEYTESIYSYDDAGRVTSTDFIIPDSEGGLAGLYYTSLAYHDNGQIEYRGYSPMGSVSTQVLQYAYDEVGNQTRILSDIDGEAVAVVDHATYSPFGEIQTRRLNSSYNNKYAYQGYQYEETTRRLERFTFDHETTAPAVADVRYTYDKSGNVLSIADLPADNTARWETQCFNYDAQRRLIEAWAQAGSSSCAAQGSESLIGGPAGYWNSYTYYNLGNRTSDSLNIVGRAPGTRTFSYPAAGQNQPHALTSIDNGDGTADTFTYDATGNLTRQDTDGETATYEWDAENANTLVSGNGHQTRTVYTAAGSELIRDEGDTATLHLPETEIVWNKQANTLDSTRYIEHAGSVVAAAKGSSMSSWRFVSQDRNGTAVYSVSAVAHSSVSIKYLDPFGMTRGETTSTWYGQRGFVGGTELSNGQVHVGARTYDPTTGRFTSVDPIGFTGDLQQLNGYSYAVNNPVTWSDPTGLCPNYMKKMKMGWLCSDRPGEIFKDPTNVAQDAMGCNKRGVYASGPCNKAAGTIVDTIKTVGNKVNSCFKGICGVVATELALFLVVGGAYVRALKWAYQGIKAARDLLRKIKEGRDEGTRQYEKPPYEGHNGGPNSPPEWPPGDDNWEYGPYRVKLEEGTIIDRFGGLEEGYWAAPVDTPFADRGIPSGAWDGDYYVLRVIKSFEVDAGTAGPAQRYAAGGTQYEFDHPIQWYVDDGFLEIIYQG